MLLMLETLARVRAPHFSVVINSEKLLKFDEIFYGQPNRFTNELRTSSFWVSTCACVSSTSIVSGLTLFFIAHKKGVYPSYKINEFLNGLSSVVL